MIRHKLSASFVMTAFLLVASATCTFARDAVIEGKDNWLFAGWESLTVDRVAAEKSSIELIADISRNLAQKNIKLIVALVPIKPRYYRTLLPDGLSISEAVEKRYDFLLAEMRSAGIVAPDLRDALKKVIAGKQQVFYRADFHWTTYAAEAAADQIADLIKLDAPLPGKAGSGTQLGEWINDRHLGDLAANFLSPEKKRLIGPDPYVIRQPASGNAGLLDADPAPVAVVGNSFVQPYFGFPQRLSNQIDRPVSLKWNPGDIGPWATLLQYFQSAEFKSPPVKFVVWQLNEGQVQNGPDAVGEWSAQSMMAPQQWRSQITETLQK
jgi:alginate O-acetyltransferase complex protein AlgJ